MLQRGIFGLLQWEALPAEPRQRTIADLAGALLGTTVGSLAWGFFADIAGRRAAILLAAIMFIGTAICGAMAR